MEGLLSQLQSAPAAALVAFVAGALLALLVGGLLRGALQAARIRRLARRAASLGAGLAPRALTNPDGLAGRDDPAELRPPFHQG